jgi:uncharacterized protein YjfI (DUF2170 family)
MNIFNKKKGFNIEEAYAKVVREHNKRMQIKMRSFGKLIIGETFEDALKIFDILEMDIEIRIVKNNGEKLCVSSKYQSNRINVEMVNDKIVSIEFFG